MTLVKFNQPSRRPVSPVLSNIFQDLFENDSFFRPFPEHGNLPAVNISESTNHYHLELSVAGFGKNEIELSIEDNSLLIEGKKEEIKEESDKKFSRKEFSFKNFQRNFTLPEDVNQEAIEAEFENGILKVNIPKMEEVKKQSRKIELK